MPKLIEESVNTVIAGAWNRAIIQPDWLRRQFPKTFSDDEFQIGLSGMPRASTVRFKFKSVELEPTDTRLTLWPSTLSSADLEAVSNIALDICRKLEHTPVLAVGQNADFVLEDKEYFMLLDFVNEDGLTSFCEEHSLFNRLSQYKHTFSFEDHNLNISYEERSDKRVVAFNFHYEAKTREKIDAAIPLFRHNYERALVLSDVLVRNADGKA